MNKFSPHVQNYREIKAALTERRDAALEEIQVVVDDFKSAGFFVRRPNDYTIEIFRVNDLVLRLSFALHDIKVDWTFPGLREMTRTFNYEMDVLMQNLAVVFVENEAENEED